MKIRKRILSVTLVITFLQFFTFTQAYALTEKITNKQLQELLSKSKNHSDIKALLAKKVEDALNKDKFQLTPDNKVKYDEDLPNVLKSGGCTHKRVYKNRSLHGLFAGDTGIEFQLNELGDHFENNIILDGTISAHLDDKHTFGVRVFGKCVRVGTATGHINAKMRVKITLNLGIDFVNSQVPDANNNLVISVTPTPSLTGNIEVLSSKVSLSGSNYFSNLFFKTLYHTVDLWNFLGGADSIRRDMVSKLIKNFDGKVIDARAEIAEKLSGPDYIFSLDDPDLLTMKLTAEALATPYLQDFMYENRRAIMYHLLADDDEGLNALLGSPAAISACSVALPALLSNSPRVPLYTKNGTSCEKLDLDLESASTGGYYTDSSCSKGVYYTPVSKLSYCKSMLTPGSLGDFSSFDLPRYSWMLPHGTRLDLNLASSVNNFQPYMARHQYKSYVNESIPPKKVTTCGKLGCSTTTVYANCQLEMRIYKSDLTATNLKPALAIHGGSWSYRSGPFAGLETHLSHLTQRGYVVFVPFYSLIGDDDGPAECQNRDITQIKADINDSLTWVQNNGATFGAAAGKVTVMGQSAGANLAAMLATGSSASSIEKALLFYPPLDAKEIVRSIKDGSYTDTRGISTFSDYLNLDLSKSNIDNIKLNDPVIVSNTFTEKVALNPSAYPPMYMLHGVSDGLVPSTQSVRMCNAYSGSVLGNVQNDGGNPAMGTYMKRQTCGTSGGVLDLFVEADHALDVCSPSKAQNGECPAGSLNSMLMVRSSILNAYNWLTPTMPATTGTSR